jgi:hypothetical protein
VGSLLPVGPSAQGQKAQGGGMEQIQDGEEATTKRGIVRPL